jgi:hypothetical protein
MITQATLENLALRFGPVEAEPITAESVQTASATELAAIWQQARVRVLLQVLKEIPLALLELKKGLSTIDLRWKPSDNEYSIQEHLCHLRDVETQRHGTRICRLVAEDKPWLLAVHGDSMAQSDVYREQHALAVINDFFQARQGNINRINALSPRQLLRDGQLAHIGRVRIFDVVRMMVLHDQKHLEIMRGIRQMLLTL